MIYNESLSFHPLEEKQDEIQELPVKETETKEESKPLEESPNVK